MMMRLPPWDKPRNTSATRSMWAKRTTRSTRAMRNANRPIRLLSGALAGGLASALAAGVVIAQSSGSDDGGRLRSISRGFVGEGRDASNINWSAILWSFAIGFIALGLIILVHQLRRLDWFALGGEYLQIAGKVGLNLRQAWFLRRLARRVGLSNPTALLLSRGTFDHWTTRYLEQSPGRLGWFGWQRSHQRARQKIRAIRRRVFGNT